MSTGQVSATPGTVDELGGDDLLPVAEVFGPTIQGEGPAAGRAAMFARFTGCNLSCSWCDTPYTWDANRFDLSTERRLTPAREVAAVLGAGAGWAGVVVLTGGEPLLQQDRSGWAYLLRRLARSRLHIETNGTLAPAPVTLEHTELIVVSPKLGNAGPHRGHQDPTLHPLYRDLARCERPSVHLKFVVEDATDVQRAAQLADQLGWSPGRTWVMPQGATAAELAARWPDVAAAAAGCGISASHRLHVLAWGNMRGR